MNSMFDLELQVISRRERLLAEAASERMARRVRTPRRSVWRTRAAATLYALADWLNTEGYGLASRRAATQPGDL
jgi:hypothetical protein